MWFLIKGSFWTTMTLVALSFLAGQPVERTAERPGVEMTEALGAAGEAYRYISALCTEKPDVCQKGAETFVVLQQRARDGAKVAYQLIDRHLADQEGGDLAAAIDGPETDALTTGTVTVIPVPHAKPAQ
ncbi:DUF5330 domain-containing protein [Rhizobiaceae bacterium BDR2-2]|uniref:DUF5330 domain-containing protein n=1 Tax=Ectorhizobium quercum TaxID=2965071 RepID=A0AAE3N0G8_9HYPH|nr:DUF5330 domain-containing protein [Ectorhizobium quercum]MCX8998488.1 DUF5330 domain-containing protein [Ectorhizobium quercum]